MRRVSIKVEVKKNIIHTIIENGVGVRKRRRSVHINNIHLNKIANIKEEKNIYA